MCMKNINANTTIEALTQEKKIITEYDKDFKCKVIPVENNQAKILVSFIYNIINGKDAFFVNKKELLFQLRITDSTGELDKCIPIAELVIDLINDKENYFVNDYVDFIYGNKDFICDLNLENFDFNTMHYLSILVKAKENIDNNDPWTIQSSTPIKFKIL